MASRPYQFREGFRNPCIRRTMAVAASFVGVATLGVISGVDRMEVPALGPISTHMAIHLFLMNALAPLLALAIWRTYRQEQASSGRSLLIAAILQVVLLWAAHIPAVIEASHDTAIHVASSGILFGVSFWFWLAVLSQRGSYRWRSIFALLLTGKLFCLLGALLVFSPRLLYPHAHDLDLATSIPDLADQHQAGLLMIVVCPLTYVFAAVLIAALWLRELSVPKRHAEESLRPAAAH